MNQIQNLQFSSFSQTYSSETVKVSKQNNSNQNINLASKESIHISLNSLNINQNFNLKQIEKENLHQTLTASLAFLKNWLEYQLGYTIEDFSLDDEETNSNVNNENQTDQKQKTDKKTSNGLSIEYNYEEHNKLDLSISGQLKIGNKNININLNVNFSQDFQEQFILENGEKKKKDPIFISYNNLIQTSNETTQMINNGQSFAVNKLYNGGLLFADNNNNNKYDENDTIFGLSTGNGFNELKTLDNNKDNFIDCQDNIFQKLKLYEMNSGETVSLQERNVQLISTVCGNTNFDLKTEIDNPYVNIKQFSFAIGNNYEAKMAYGIDFYVK